LERSLKAKFPGLNVVGTLSPPFAPQALPLDADTAARINAAGADIIWVGLGSPKQDVWNALNRAALNAPVLIGIGAAFDFLSGMKPQAPEWMQALGLEWLFRLWCEPRRLWRRYLIGNAHFIWLLAINGLKKKP
jgi:N-acetylglucosaminyldiphosphoundecaprenol N-acetyl-beta-D-mannosaminyltransferase